MPLCIDCMYFIVNGSKCGRSAGMPDYVRGYPPRARDAQLERIADIEGACGPQAKYFALIPVAA